jgi:hypothetical protein
MDRDAVKFLKRCETDGIQLKKRLTYMREWTDKERRRGNRRKRWAALSIRQAERDG